MHIRAILVIVAPTVLMLPARARAQTDTADVRKELERSASEYETAIRRQAPHRLMQNSFCDETVGRFCVVYDVGTTAATPVEPEPVKRARQRAIEAFRRGVDVWPTDSTLIAPLLRYLVEDGQSGEAVQLARQYAETSADRVWAQLLVGFALHGASDEVGAESVFARTMPMLLPSERVGMLDVTSLLDRAEQERYQNLRGQDRARYQEQLWRLADPLYLTEGNETLVEHLTRNVYGRILAYAPPSGEFGWGPDVAELTLRFGVPTGRTQNFGNGMGGKRYTEHFAPNQLTYVPPAMVNKGGLWAFEPGSAWPYDTIRSRSGYAPASIRRMVVLEHQVARFPGRNGGEVRADYVLPADSAVRLPARYVVGLFALDSTYQVLSERRDTVTVSAPATSGTITMPLPVGMAAYSLEAIELDSKLASRARYSLPAPGVARPQISDVTILRAGDEEAPPAGRTTSAFRPFASLVLPRGEAIGLYLEARSLVADANREVRYRVDLEVLEQSSPGTFSRAVRRLSRALGLGGDDVAPKITWNQQQNVAETNVIALKLGRIDMEPGVKLFKLTVTDLQTGKAASTERLVRVVNPR